MKGGNMSLSLKKTRLFGLCLVASAACAVLYGASTPDPSRLKMLIEQADFYVREFEREVSLQRGGEKMGWRSKRDALDRVQKLKQTYPHDPRVEDLFQRVKAALMKSKGDYTQVVENWTAYKRNEEALRKVAKLHFAITTAVKLG